MNYTQKTTETIHLELSQKVDDAKALLTAIESLLANEAVGDNIVRVKGELHSLVWIALERAREAASLSDELEGSMMAARRAA